MSAIRRCKHRRRWCFALLPIFCLSALAIPACRAPATTSSAAKTDASGELLSTGDTAFTPIQSAERAPRDEMLAGRDALLLAVLHVQIPAEQAASAARVWNHIRENVMDDTMRLRLRRNGIRFGIGRVDDWAPIKAVLDSIDGAIVFQATPLRVPSGFPLALELSPEPRAQTLFYVDASDTLRGNTWPASRNVLTATYVPDPATRDRLLLQIVPQVHQELEGWRWVRTQAGMWQVPNQYRTAFPDAALDLVLGPDEFVLITPDEADGNALLLGNAFLTAVRENRRYNSYVFLRPEVTDVGQRSQ